MGTEAKQQKEAVQCRASGRCATHTAGEVLLRLPSAPQPYSRPRAQPASPPQVPALSRAATQPAVLPGADWGWFLPPEHLHSFEISRRNQRLEDYARTSSAPPDPPPEQDAVSEGAGDGAWREERGREDWAWEELAPKGEKWRRRKKNRFA